MNGGDPYLESLAADTNAVAERVAAYTALSDRQLQWKPESTSWSILECIEHLVLTARAYHPVLVEALDAAPEASGKPYRPKLLARMFIAAVSPDPKLKVKTLGSVTPASSSLDRTVLNTFLSLQVERTALLERAARIDLNRVKIRSPLNRFLRLSVGEAFTVLVRHEERHVQQADRVRERDGFPAPNG